MALAGPNRRTIGLEVSETGASVATDFVKSNPNAVGYFCPQIDRCDTVFLRS